MQPKILLISQHSDIIDPLITALETNGISAHINSILSPSGRKPRSDRFDLVINLWKKDQTTTESPGQKSQRVSALFMLNDPNFSNTIEIYQNGVYTFSTKKNDTRKFIRTVKDLLENRSQSVKKLDYLKPENTGRTKLNNIIGKSSEIVKLRNLIRKISRKPDFPILITGETGTGKELVAHALHYSSPRADKPFVKINCSAIPENLLESHLFGHKKGAFTGASTDKKGLFEEADGGTILLDEIGEMDPKLQPKLLRFLENQTFHRVGSAKEIKVDVWILASTNVSLHSLIDKGLFRRDLFYRLNTLNIEIPSLRERKQDIPILIKEFLRQEGSKNLLFNPDVMKKIYEYDWPGNVRELKNMIKCLTLLIKSIFSDKNIEPQIT